MSLIQTKTYFNPLTVPNCALWLDGSDPFGTGKIPPNRSTISSWTDKSSNAVAFSTSGAPTFSTGVYNNNGLIVFNGSTMLVNSSFTYALQTRTLFVVAQQTAYNNNNCGILSFARGTCNDATLANTISYNTGYFGGSAFQIVSQFPGLFFNYTGFKGLTPLNVYSDTNIGQQETAFINGSQQYQISYPTVGGTSLGLTIGCRVNDPARFLFGYIAEVVVYNYTLSITQRQQVEGYLAQKWGLRSRLPDGHFGTRITYYNVSKTANMYFTNYEVGHVGANVPSIYFSKKSYIYTSSNFYPTLFGTGLLLWLDAFDPTTIVTSGNYVTSWQDKSGFSNNAIAPPLTGPSYTPWTNDSQKASVYFNGTSYMQINNNFMNTLNGTVFAVFQAPTAAANPSQTIIQDQGAWGMSDFQLQPSQFVVSTFQSSIVTPFATPVTSFAITSIEIIKQQSTINTYLNGSLSQTAKFSSFYSTGDSLDLPNLGRYTSSGIETQVSRFTGDLQEIIVYNSTLTSNMRQAVEGYLAWKWFLQTKLPTSHPYYIAAPTCNAAYATAPGITSATIAALPNLLVWFDTSVSLAAYANGSSVASMPAVFTMAGCNIFSLDGTPTVTTAVQNNYPVLTFNGYSGQSAIMQPTGYNSGAAFTIIFLYRQTGGLNQRFAQCSGGNNYFFGYWAGYKNTWYMDGWITNSSGPAGDTLWDINVFQSDAAGNGIFRNNGSNVSLTATNTNGIKGMGFNTTGTNVYEPSNAQLAEMYIFNTNIPSSNYILIEGYLAWKWGLQSRLNPSHAYASVNPVSYVYPIIMPSAVALSAPTVFTYTGANQTYIVPNNVGTLLVVLWGAGGGCTINTTTRGGAGACLQGYLPVIKGESLTIIVGQGGMNSQTSTASPYGGGGAPGGGVSGWSSSGGGRSAIRRGATDLVTVGAGGGGRQGSIYGGAGGITTGGAGTGTATAGTQTSGGGGANAGSLNAGGAGGQDNSAGGGSGFYGGGGGGQDNNGGGGSSLFSNLVSYTGYVSSDGATAPNNTSPYYVSGVANGGASTSLSASIGGNGLVVILYLL